MPEWLIPKGDTLRLDVRGGADPLVLGVADPFLLATTSVARASVIGLDSLEILEYLEKLEELEHLQKLEQQATFAGE